MEGFMLSFENCFENLFKKWFAVVCFKNEWRHLLDVGHYIAFVLCLIDHIFTEIYSVIT